MLRSFIALIAVLSLWPVEARAQGEEEIAAAMELDRQARERFQAGDLEEALELMVAAQALAPATPRLYNLAVCHERLGNRAEAIEYYQRFVEEVDRLDERRELAQERIERLRSEREDSGDPPAISGSGDPETAERPGEGEGLSTTPFWVVFGVTAALGAASVVLGSVTLSFHSDWEANALDDDFQSTGRAMAHATDALIGLTAASALTALILVFFTQWGDDPSEPRGQRPRLTAAMDRGGARAGLELTF